MSNNYKSTLQQNNAKLSSNNLYLQNLIDQANALPDGGEGSVETCTVTFTTTTNNKSVYYTEGSGNLQNVTMSINEVATFTVLKNTIMYVNNASTASVSGDCTTLYNTMGKGIFVISGDCTISV
jgi:hypothetical protein